MEKVEKVKKIRFCKEMSSTAERDSRSGILGTILQRCGIRFIHKGKIDTENIMELKEYRYSDQCNKTK